MALVRPRSTMLDLAEGPELTMASGAVTLTHGQHPIDTEGDAVTDDLATINGGYTGQVVTLRRATAGRVVVLVEGGNIILGGPCRDGTGNLKCGLVLDEDSITLRYDGTNWVELHRSMGFLGVYLARTTNQTIPTSTFTNIAWETAVYDVGGWAPNLGSDPDGVFVPEGVFAIKAVINAAWQLNASGSRVVEFRDALGTGGHRALNIGSAIPVVLVATKTYSGTAPGNQCTGTVWHNIGSDGTLITSASGGTFMHVEAIR